MTSTFGTDSGFYSIADEHLYLYLQNNGGGIVGDTDLNYCNFYQFGVRDDNMILGREKDNDLLNKQYIDDVVKYHKNCDEQLNLKKPVEPKSSKHTSIYSILSEMNYISETKKLIDKADYDFFLQTQKPITFFAFDNDSVEIANDWISKHPGKHYIKEFLKAHTLPFELNPYTMAGRKVKLTTLSPSNYLYADGRGKDLVFYIQTTNLQNFTYPHSPIIIKAKGWIQTENGWLYVLETPIIPNIII